MGFKRFIWEPVTDAYLGEQDETGATIATYTQEPVPYGSLISQRRSGQTSYYHYDGLGNTRELTNASEVVTDTNLYDAWGVNVASIGTTENPFKWRGRVGYYFDAATDDYYVRARTYEPNSGRWFSIDPLHFVDGTNLYRPVFVPTMSDPSGEFLYPSCCEFKRTCRCLFKSFDQAIQRSRACDSDDTGDAVNPLKCCEIAAEKANEDGDLQEEILGGAGILHCGEWRGDGAAGGFCPSDELPPDCVRIMNEYLRQLAINPRSQDTNDWCVKMCHCRFEGSPEAINICVKQYCENWAHK